MLAFERKSKILEFLERYGNAEVTKMSNMLGVVPETIRRDLRDFEKKGILVRTHGGALIKDPKQAEFPVQIREMKNSLQKENLCQRAAAFITDDDMIFVDNSSTLIHLIKYIDEKIHVTILTNSIQLILESTKYKKDNITMICTGGIFNKHNMSLSGVIAGKYAHELFPNKAFISCHGISSEFGFTDGNFLEVGFKREMISLANKVFILADQTKFGKLGPIRLGDFEICDCLITDQAPTDEFTSQIKQSNPSIELIIAEKGEDENE